MKKINLTMKRTSPDGTVELMDKTTDYDETLWLMSVAGIAAEYHSLVEYSNVETLWFNNDIDNLPDEVSYAVEFPDGTELTKAVMRE